MRIKLEPLAIELELTPGSALLSALAEHGMEFPCGGTAICGGCRVRVLSGTLPVTDADREFFSRAELEAGWRLTCQARPQDSLVLEYGQWQMDVLADNASLSGEHKKGLGIAIDLGTTTIAAQLMDLSSGRILAVQTALNPQCRFGSDVMSRVHASLSGADLTVPVRECLRRMIVALSQGQEEAIAEVVLVGNTVMHHLFGGLDVGALSSAPFVSSTLGVLTLRPQQLGWPLPADCRIRFVACLGGFVGSDILAGILATGMHKSDEPVALVDLGTNGEIAIGSRDGIVCASTAAGPAFESGCIRMGMRAVAGAISQVELRNGALQCSVIGNVEPRGICGSGLVDAVAAGLEMGIISPSGRIANREKSFPIAGPVVLYQSDIRELQLAKAAIASGFTLLARRLGVELDRLRAVFLAGAFGNYVRVESALRIGLIPAPRTMVHSAGNTALRGAKMLLLRDEDPVLPRIEHIGLAGEPEFEDEFARCMAFPDRAATELQGVSDRVTSHLPKARRVPC